MGPVHGDDLLTLGLNRPYSTIHEVEDQQGDCIGETGMLEPPVKQKLLQRFQQLNAEGKLLSRTQLDQYYGTFRSRFGPDKLANLDGEALLTTMHAHGTKDSLVYWLEFKDDAEFPARFGGIGGGT